LLAGCTAGSPASTQETVYVAVYHWGFALFDEDGTERDEIRIPRGTELTLYAVNDHAHDAIHRLPEPVAKAVEELHPLERTKEHVAAGRIPAPWDGTIEEKYEETHDHDAGLGDHSLIIPDYHINLSLNHHQEAPAKATFTPVAPGVYPFVCGTHCGYGHAFMNQELLIVE
jgi:hypothetical protein